MMYIFGYNDNIFDAKEVLRIARAKELLFLDIPVSQVIDVLAGIQKMWAIDQLYYTQAYNLLIKNNISDKDAKSSLDTLYALLDRKCLEERFKSEFGSLSILEEEKFISPYLSTQYTSLGVLLHICAGNIFLGAIDSLIMGLLTKNTSIVKLSSSNYEIPLLFAKSIYESDLNQIISDKFSLLIWKGGSFEVEDPLKQGVDGILTWGGEDMVKSYQKDLPSHVRLINHGPKISFNVISKNYYEKYLDYDQLANDICTYEQKACASSQNIFIESGINYHDFTDRLSKALQNKGNRPTLSGDEYVELLKDNALGEYQEYLSGNKQVIMDSYQINFDHNIINPSALNRSVKIKRFESINDLGLMLKKFQFYLQTCGLGVIKSEDKHYSKLLSYAGVTRITSIGGMLIGQEGAPHDGFYALKELTKIISKECHTPTLKMTEGLDTPLTDSSFIQKYNLMKSDKLLAKDIKPGLVFSSGGTTGNPKFINYSYEEFNYTCKLLAHSYIDLGLKKNDKVANMFMAGNMWSSFSAIQNALEICEVNQFPLGGQMSHDDAFNIISGFNIKIIFGLPSMITIFAGLYPNLEVEKIFYAGESFTKSSKQFLQKNWGVKEFISAGYACVDVGPIGYQDQTCSDSEHILFDGLGLEVINGEGVITSSIRKNMPVIRYKTGDKIEIISRGKKSKFKLLGRADQMINIWSSRFFLEDIDLYLASFAKDIQYQIILNVELTDGIPHDKLILRIHSSENIEVNIKDLYHSLKDVKDTHDFNFFSNSIEIQYDKLMSSDKTGKIKKIIDLR